MDTIGNPALDVGDILSFSGGQADATKYACITSNSIKIGGRQSIKCVGKNPKLSQAKSKNDKNISGLLAQIETGKIGIHTFTNASAFTVADVDTKIISIEFAKMAHLQYLVFNNEIIPMPASYYVSLSDVEADSGGVTEAGTTQRDVVREGVVQIGVTFRVSKRWLKKFSAYKKLASITVGYLDMETMNIVNTQMYIDGYQVKLVSDTSYGSLWEVSFTLKEF